MFAGLGWSLVIGGGRNSVPILSCYGRSLRSALVAISWQGILITVFETFSQSMFSSRDRFGSGFNKSFHVFLFLVCPFDDLINSSGPLHCAGDFPSDRQNGYDLIILDISPSISEDCMKRIIISAALFMVNILNKDNGEYCLAIFKSRA